MRNIQFTKDCFYHIYNRGVDKRSIFVDDFDRMRFLNSCYVLNNFTHIPREFNIIDLEPKELLIPINPFVDILAGCLMPNHYHFVLTPLTENGISNFLHKIGTSYTKYFNIKHERTGSLFESTFQARLVDRQEYAFYLTQYIHLNPIKLFQPRLSKENIIKSIKHYAWSTLPDYLDLKSNFSHLISIKFRDEILNMGSKEYDNLVNDVFESMCHPKA